MSRTILGSLIGALAVTALAAPLADAAGRPADVTVRVEGPRGTLVDTPVTTTTAAVVKDGDRAHACSGTSAAGALEQATEGEWTASYFRGLGYAVDAIDGVRPASANDYWTLWVNDRSSLTGLCDTELQDGDELLLFVCTSGPDFNCTNAPLGLVAPRTRNARPTVQVISFGPDGRTTPAAGATVSGGAAPVRADAQGNARVTLKRGESTLRATRTGSTPSARLFCADGRCGSSDRTPPLLSVRGISDGQTFAPARAPRALRGVARGLDGGIVELRLARRHDGRCTAYVGRIEDFVRCPRRGAPWFQAADRERWSYLLPARLAPGRYTLGVIAADGAGNSAKPLVVRFTVAERAAASAAVASGAHAVPGTPGAVVHAAAAPRVPVRVVGASGSTLARRTVAASATTAGVGRKRCAVAGGTPLAALLAVAHGGGPSVKLADFGSCGRRAADGSGLYVTSIAGKRAAGQAGWVYAVGGRLGSAGAADPSGPFGSGLLKGGQSVVWFWCKRANACEKEIP
ncbi:hypothetical protein VSS74_28370 [Conexibacter stalactiti]|uniref:DUF4430 domain-containing protein n=1 Tax=Conexibacter stalactiti TaxID=1940611 RepID=A0ABU4HYA3_9ACTN|nr:hypothetical protein [Conexibacter stalactiti]MDW5598307.1 hypothetical protein [Conexibacter stalactiti]MEC5038949.1 hypothetical protein [Conexibacter stalactiti]